ncbi:Rid family detoxifying hydrolase [Halorussus gelatinilyticus]|uniref:Rid family detoxifying hydrolase n=1 Tax=Halorussus gelatinilyticus TaxID=2937524 RepID=A0A8U0IL19_9EURY|nr:Rid family detoxifying hydrolase [Halorussus gelatinilyticus]UPW01847.1 Rid family detoxifying hydrolase [Halorussus gelatinilyticus]
MKRIISTQDAPEAVGAYSQATTNGDMVFTAGQIPMTPDGDLLDDEEIAVQTRQSLENVKAILEEEGLTMQDVLKVTVFLDDIEDFDEMNDAYKEYFQDNPPARSAVEAGNLPKGVGVEIEVIASSE